MGSAPARRLQILVTNGRIPLGIRGPTLLGTRAARFWILLLLIVQTGFLSAAAAGARNVPIAVIVHDQVPVDELSLPELRRIFLGSRQSWSEGLAITVLAPPRGSAERQVLLDEIYEQRSETQYQQYWINKMFSDGAPALPKSTGSPRRSASLVRGIPGAIALVPASKIPPGVKILRIDGKRPGAAGYPLVTSR